jgi:hypothetical protein
MLKAMGGNCERRFMCRQKSADFGRRSHQFGRASAPMMPHRVQTMRGPNDGTAM